MTSETEVDVWSIGGRLIPGTVDVVYRACGHCVRYYLVQVGECLRCDKHTIVRNLHCCIATVMP
jgi:hypothetical protein